MKSAAGPAGALAGVKGRMAELVVSGALLRLTQGLVGLAQFLETFLRGLVTGVFVRMIFDREFAVSLFYVLVAGVLVNAKDFVVVAFGHREFPLRIAS